MARYKVTVSTAVSCTLECDRDAAGRLAEQFPDSKKEWLWRLREELPTAMRDAKIEIEAVDGN